MSGLHNIPLQGHGQISRQLDGGRDLTSCGSPYLTSRCEAINQATPCSDRMPLRPNRSQSMAFPQAERPNLLHYIAPCPVTSSCDRGMIALRDFPLDTCKLLKPCSQSHDIIGGRNAWLKAWHHLTERSPKVFPLPCLPSVHARSAAVMST